MPGMWFELASLQTNSSVHVFTMGALTVVTTAASFNTPSSVQFQQRFGPLHKQLATKHNGGKVK
jgi:hypothetical protein